MKITKEIEEFINLTITEHMGKEYADWKLSQPSVTEPDEVEEEYKKVIATLPQKQEEAITKYCDQIFNSGAETEEFFYRLGLRDGMKLRKNVKMVLKQLSDDGHCKQCKGFVWLTFSDWCDESYCNPGDTEYCGSYQFTSKYRCYSAVYQLWRYVNHIPDGGNRACFVCVKRHQA